MLDKCFLHLYGILALFLANVSISKKLTSLIKHKFIPIYYGGYWDVPDSFLTEYKSEVYLFTRGDFDDELDDYPPNYEVYNVKNITFEDSVKGKLWFPYNYEEKIFLGEIPTADVIFDWSHRKFVNTIVFEMVK